MPFAIPEGTASITQPNLFSREGHDSWQEWGVNKEEVTSVTIPTTLTSIGIRGFSGCRSLARIVIPASVTRIAALAFLGCSSLTHIDIPTSVSSIEESAFNGCRRLTNVEIPSSVASIARFTFRGCSSLTRVAIPASVTSIEQHAFCDCRSLASVGIPTSVTSIAGGAFNGCSSLASVTIPASVTSIEREAFQGCSSLTRVAIPATVTSIGLRAFAGCSSLTSVEIPASVKTLSGTRYQGDALHGAFEGCPSVAVLLVQPNDPPDDADAATATTAAAATTSTSAIVKAFNEQNQFPAVTQIWATDDVIEGLNGLFEAYNQFKDVPRALRAAPDAKTWAGVQLWLWWLPPTSFSADAGGGGSNDGQRVVCKSRRLTIWATMLGGLRAEETSILPRLPEELWLYTFGFLKHDQQPTCVAQEF